MIVRFALRDVNKTVHFWIIYYRFVYSKVSAGGANNMISDNIKRLRENAGLSQAALARKLGVTRASVNAWEMELSTPTAQYLIALAQLFHTTTDDILGLESQEQIVLRGMNEQEKRLVYDLISYITERKEEE